MVDGLSVTIQLNSRTNRVDIFRVIDRRNIIRKSWECALLYGNGSLCEKPVYLYLVRNKLLDFAASTSGVRLVFPDKIDNRIKRQTLAGVLTALDVFDRLHRLIHTSLCASAYPHNTIFLGHVDKRQALAVSRCIVDILVRIQLEIVIEIRHDASVFILWNSVFLRPLDGIRNEHTLTDDDERLLLDVGVRFIAEQDADIINHLAFVRLVPVSVRIACDACILDNVPYNIRHISLLPVGSDLDVHGFKDFHVLVKCLHI